MSFGPIEIVKLDEPIVLCAICGQTGEDCDGTHIGPHVYDGLRYYWGLIDATGRLISVHINHVEASRAVRSHH